MTHLPPSENKLSGLSYLHQLRFCKVGYDKKPVHKNWQAGKEFSEVVGYSSIGIVFGNLIAEIDCDHAVELLKYFGIEKNPLSFRYSGWSKESFGLIGALPPGDYVGKVTIYQGKDGKPCERDEADTYTKWDGTQGLRHLELRYTGHYSIISGQHPSGSQYQTEWMAKLNELPRWAVDKLSTGSRKRTKSAALVKQDERDDLEIVTDIATAKAALEKIGQAQDYEQWIRVGMALKSVDESLLTDWIEWSSTAENFSGASECECRWNSFRKNGYTLGTLIYLAYPKAKPIGLNGMDLELYPADREIDVISQEEFPNWYCIGEQYVHVQRPDLRWSKTKFNNLLPRQQIVTQKGRSMVPASQVVTNKAIDIEWHPGKPRLVKTINGTVINSHVPYRPGVEGDATPWIDHIYKLYPDQADAIIWYLAYTIQRPGVKINWALFLASKRERVGKDTILQPLRWAMQNEFRDVSADELLEGGFNGWLLGAKLVTIQEPKDSDNSRWRLKEKLKTFIAAPPDKLLINEKYGGQRYQANLNNTIILSNHLGSIDLSERGRYLPCYTEKAPESAEYYNELYSWLESGGNEVVIGFLRTVDLNKYDPKILPIIGTGLQDAIDATKTDFDQVVEEVIQDEPVTDLAEISRRLRAEGLTARRTAITAALDRLGYERSRKRIALQVGGVVAKATAIHPIGMAESTVKKELEDAIRKRTVF